MRSMLVSALVATMALSALAFAQGTTLPVPPARENPVGEAPAVEQGPAVKAEAVPPPAAPKVEAVKPIPAPPPAPPPPPPPPPPEKAPVSPPAEQPAPPPVPAETPKPPPAKDVSSTLGEVELAEKVAVSRESYRLALETLKRYYVEARNATKLEWVDKELGEFNGITKYHYLSELELASADLRPVSSIAAADQLFKEGLDFKNYPAFPPEKKDKLRVALDKFRTIITSYPNSDKIDDAAFRMGEIYEGWYFQDYTRAVQCYERCFQWNERSEYPAVFNAARLYDQKLMQRDKAVELYNMVVRLQQKYQNQKRESVDEAVKRLNELKAPMGRP